MISPGRKEARSLDRDPFVSSLIFDLRLDFGTGEASLCACDL